MTAELTDPFLRERLQDFVAPPPQGKRQPDEETGVDTTWDYEKAGLIRPGTHTDTHVLATAADGTQIPVDVVPMPHDGGSKTIFVIDPGIPGNPERSRQIFQRPDRFI